MITANELMIGNYLYNDKVVVKIDARSIFDIWEKSKYYKPILITQEWLLKFGFEITESNGLLNLSINDFTRMELMPIKPEYCVYLVSKNNLDICISLNRIKYINQLQNLYFALTGQELEIK